MTKSFAGVLVVTAVLGLAVGAGAGYLTLGRGATATPQAVAVAQAQTQGGGANGAGFTPGKPGGANNNATIEKVDGTTATVKTGNGSVDVPLASATLQKQEKVAPTDLKVGDNVFGRGEPNAQGVVMLNNLQIVANLPGRGGQGGADAATKPGGNGGNGGNAGQGGRQGGNFQGGNGGGRQGAGGQGNAEGGGQGGFQAGQGNARGLVAGSISKIDGKNLTINAPNGSEMTATLAEGVQVERIAPAQPADLKTGQTVALQRPPGGNGNTILTIVSG